MDITIPSLEEMWTCIQDAFGVRPCDFQIQDTFAQLQQKDVITSTRLLYLQVLWMVGSGQYFTEIICECEFIVKPRR